MSVLTYEGLEYYDSKIKNYIEDCYTPREEFEPDPDSEISGSTWGALTESDIEVLLGE